MSPDCCDSHGPHSHGHEHHHHHDHDCGHGHDHAHSPEDEAPNLSQIGSVVDKLEDVIVVYLESGAHLGLEPDADQVLHAVRQALEEAHADENFKPAFEETPMGFYLSGLYEELVQQASNIFEQVTLEDGKARYVPLARPVWIACLQGLEARLLALRS
jgi:ABC-type Zn2+ transport system substrate-binding protein/surface adhesin